MVIKTIIYLDFIDKYLYFCTRNGLFRLPKEKCFMTKCIKMWLAGLFCLCILLPVRAVRPQDSIRFSLLTCAPGSEIYELFGHTALRYQNFSDQTDLVFNYGMFSFNTPHFVFRFVKGETDYQLGIMPYPYFESEYALRGSSVYQQELNLTPAEKRKLFSLLEENYRPENRIYRYNYFYDNCTTRARDQIERCIDGTVVYPEGQDGKTFRGIVHEFTAGSSWDELGIDLCLGAEADKPIGNRLQMFSPFYMRDFASQAYILQPDGSRRPLVLRETKIVDVVPEKADPSFPLSPMQCASCFLALLVLVAWWQWRIGRVWWGWDLFLFGLQGLAGCIITFLFFFSVHPTVGSNWMLILFNPLPLLLLPWGIRGVMKGKKDWFYRANCVYLTLFIMIFPFSSQEFNLTVLPLALGLLVNSVSHVLVLKKRYK